MSFGDTYCRNPADCSHCLYSKTLRRLWPQTSVELNVIFSTISVKACERATAEQAVFLYGPPTNRYVAYTVIRRKNVFIWSASYAVYAKLDSCRLLVILPANPSIGRILWEDLSGIVSQQSFSVDLCSRPASTCCVLSKRIFYESGDYRQDTSLC